MVSYFLGIFVLFALAVIGATHIIVDPASIAKPFREWLKEHGTKWLNEMVDCYQCCGFWVGLFFGIFLFGLNPILLFSFYQYGELSGLLLGLVFVSMNPMFLFAYGCSGSFLASLAATWLNYLEARSLVDIDIKESEL